VDEAEGVGRMPKLSLFSLIYEDIGICSYAHTLIRSWAARAIDEIRLIFPSEFDSPSPLPYIGGLGRDSPGARFPRGARREGREARGAQGAMREGRRARGAQGARGARLAAMI
jgi:hypothetical protein